MASERISERDWSNGFSGLLFKQLPDGRWLVGGATFEARVLPSVELGLKLRRRGLAILGAWLVSLAATTGLGLGVIGGLACAVVACVALWSAVYEPVRRLPLSGYRFGRRATLYQARGFVLAMAGFALAVGAISLHYGVSQLGTLLVLTSLVFLAGFGWALGYSRELEG